MQARALRREAERRPRAAARVLDRAVQLRALLYPIFTAVAAGERPPVSELAAFNALLAEANGRLRVVPSKAGYAWEWAGEAEMQGAGGKPPPALERMLWPIVRSAADLLTCGELKRVKLCDADDCGWLFVDVSRNRSRRWCDMADCGNRAKARRYRKRHASAP